MKRFFISILSAFALIAAQGNNDALIFDAMQIEMERTMNELRVPDMPAPFFINYIVSEGETISITAALGSVVSSRHQPMVRSAMVRVMAESNELTNDTRFNNQGVTQVPLTISNDLDQLRRGIWRASDTDFRRSLGALTNKRNALRRITLSPAEEALLDFHPAAPVVMSVPTNFQPVNRAELEGLIERLSAVFLDFPQLYGSNVLLSAAQSTFYTVTSEGTRTRQPLSQAIIRASARVRAIDGAVLNDRVEIVVNDLSKLPSEAELRATVVEFATALQALGNAPLVSEYYHGPVLFEGDAVINIFLNSLLAPRALNAHRRPIIGEQQSVRNIPIGRRILDTRFTVINHTQKTDFNGIPLVGAYSVDADGIAPQPSLVLVERGMLINYLNNRIPTEFAARSNGNQRIGATPGFITTDVRPSVLEIQATGGLSRQALRQKLMNTAREEGLEYAYIVRKTTGATRIYQVDVNTGAEKLMRSPQIEAMGIRRLSRVEAVSSDIQVANRILHNQHDPASRTVAFPVSVISPEAILFQDVEINASTVTFETKPTTSNPLLRER